MELNLDNVQTDINPVNLILDLQDDMIPSVGLDLGGIIVGGRSKIYYDTTANWNAQPSLVGEQGALYIYSDYQVIYDEVGNPTFVPGIKVGDGSAYLIDTPFVSQKMMELLTDHINNTTIHVTQAEKDFWNKKVAARMDSRTDEVLMLYSALIAPDGML